MIIRDLKCPYCDKVLSRYSVWKSHIFSSHMKGNCPICGMKCKSVPYHVAQAKRYEEKDAELGFRHQYDHSELYYLFAEFKEEKGEKRDVCIAKRNEAKRRMVERCAMKPPTTIKNGEVQMCI